MRFLCLHGAGTSAEIFEIQSGGITQMLEDDGHTFVYVDGRTESEPEPELKGAGLPPFFTHYPRDRAPGPDLRLAIAHAKDIIAKQGPFDGVMGFSQGGALAGALLVDHAKTHAEPLFKVAVFVCSATSYDPASEGTELLSASTPDGTYPITIPTAHIVGKQDPVLGQSMKQYGLCEPAVSEFYDHESRHLIPFDAGNTLAMAETIRRAIAKVK